MAIYTVENTIEAGLIVRVFVGRKEVDGITYIDTDKGVIKRYVDPVQVIGEEILQEELHVDPARIKLKTATRG